ncbi:MAG: hypothetical protein KAG28_03085 [Cocleimonas sp.]|nr:hypothetical protein [Cocleimonas sp.]
MTQPKLIVTLLILLSGCNSSQNDTQLQACNNQLKVVKNKIYILENLNKKTTLQASKVELLTGEITFVSKGTDKEKLVFYTAMYHGAKAFVKANDLGAFIKDSSKIKTADLSGYDRSILHEYFYYKGMMGELKPR